MIREDDLNQSKTKVFTYDQGGNITSINEYDYTLSDTLGDVKNTITYGYADTNWKDKLTSYNGQTITYDEIGNPLSYNGYTYDWDNGRELKSITGNGLTASYTYDENELRVSKTVNGAKTSYEYVSGQLLYEKKGSTELHYFYDINGSLKGIQTVDSNGTSTTYYVVTNTRGDVTQIYDVAGVLQVLYTYDAWGKILSIKDGNGNEITSDTNIGKLNSLRYRSYYYDTETGLYYVGSRYYDPNTCRFLNADSAFDPNAGLLSSNQFIYCANNPVNETDPDGNFAQLAAAGAYGAYLSIGAEAGVANCWNPVGWTILGVCGVATIAIAGYGIYKYSISTQKGSSQLSPRNFKTWKKSGGPWWDPNGNGKILIATKALSDVFNKYYQKGVDVFLNAEEKGFVGPKGQSGIKTLVGGIMKNGIKYTYEIKVFGECADYRIYGYLNSSGQYIFDWFSKALH